MAASNNGQIVDDFESSFQACLAALTNPDYFSVRDSEEIKTGVEQTIQRFLDLAKQMECFFLQKRLLLSVQKPEQIILEDINELKNELARKDQLFQKYYEKVGQWQALLSDISGSPVPRSAPQTPNPVPQGPLPMPSQGPPPPNVQLQMAQQQPNQPQQMQHHMPPPPNQGMPPGLGMQIQQSPGMVPQPAPPQMMPGPHMGAHMQPQGGLQGPLAYLERTTSNIGLPDRR